MCAAIRVSLPPLNAHLLKHIMHNDFCYVCHVFVLVHALFMHGQVAEWAAHLLTTISPQRDCRPHEKSVQGCAPNTSQMRAIICFVIELKE